MQVHPEMSMPRFFSAAWKLWRDIILHPLNVLNSGLLMRPECFGGRRSQDFNHGCSLSWQVIIKFVKFRENMRWLQIGLWIVSNTGLQLYDDLHVKFV